MPVYPSGGTIAQSVGSPGFGPAPAPSYTSPGSVRFNRADGPSIGFTPTLQGNRSLWTFACWFKRSTLGARQFIIANLNSTAVQGWGLEINASDQLDIYDFNNPTYVTRLLTTQVFRDPSQWYHLTYVYDTTQATSSNRLKLYINGVQVTAFGTATYPSQYYQGYWNQAGVFSALGNAGSFSPSTTYPWGGYLAEMYLIDGLALTPASFTETSSTTGQLIPISTGYTGVYGTNGFYLPFSSNALAVDLGQNKKVTGQDGYWPYNTLLVNTTNTNGQQNNTFLDSSTNNFTITRNGNTTQGRFGPFAPGGGTTQANGYFSGYFDGTGDYLSLPASGNASYINGTGNFTIDFWVYYNALPTGSVGANTGCSWYAQDSGLAIVSPFNLIQAGNTWYLYADTGAGTWNIFSQVTIATTTLSAGQWYHVACVRDSTNIRLYINGVQVGTASIGAASIWQNTVRNLYLFGAWQNTAGSTGLNGYVSNYRLVKGTCLYPGGTTFTVPTTPLTNITNTSLLTCQSSQFIDNSTNAFAITVNGNSQPTPANPFGMTAWSGYFDGTGDYLTVPNNAAFNLGSGNATIEAWVFPASSGQTCGIFDKRSVGTNYSQFPQVALVSGAFVAYVSYTGSSWAGTINGATPAVNAWTHVAFVRNGNTWTLYVNGVVSGTPFTAAGSVYTSTDNLVIGASTTAGLNPINGAISNARIVKGTAVYTSNFTPPTAPLTAITNTQLLTCQSSTFVDNSPNAFAITVNGNSYTGTLNNPFGNPINYTTPPAQAWSTYFDGSGDYILSPAGTPTYGIGTGNWTFESWVYTTSTATTQTVWLYYTTNTDAIRIFINGSTGVFSCEVRATNRTAITSSTTSGSIRLNQWHHIAAARDSATNITMYVDGKALATIALGSTTTWADTTMFTGNPSIGAKTNVITEYFAGYISNLRFVRGSAVYTSNFTPPTSPLTAIPGTMTLACQSNRVLDNSLLNVAQALYGNALISPLSPFIPTTAWTAASNGGSMYFDGTGDYLNAGANAAFAFGTGDFTVEVWIYTPATQTQFAAIACNINNPDGWFLSFSTSNLITFSNWNTTALTSSVAVPIGTWAHVAVSRSGTSIRMFINGQQVASATNSTTYGVAGSATYVGYNSQTHYFSGYMSNLRILKGTALYTTTFVPPVLPPTNISNTSLLLNATNAGIYDATGVNNIETVGNAQVSTAVKKWGESSTYFDGSGDYLQAPNSNSNSNLSNFGSSDFTIELWMYASSQALAPIVHQTSYASNQGWVLWNYDGVNVATSTRRLTFMLNGASFTLTTSSDAYNNNTWTHIAVVKIGTGSNNIKIYSNGVNIASGTYATALTNATTPLGIGGIINGVSWNGTAYYTGYMQDLRISRVGRYSGNFTPPAAAFAYNVQDVGFQQWTPTNISVTAGVGNDSLTDTVSDSGTDTGVGGQVRGNYATLNPLNKRATATLSNGNLTWSANGTFGFTAGTFGVSSGKWYFEYTLSSNVAQTGVGVVPPSTNTTYIEGDPLGIAYYSSGQLAYFGGLVNSWGATYTVGDVIGIALDLDSGKIFFSKNNVWQASGNPTTGTNPARTGLSGTYTVGINLINSSGLSSGDWNFGQRAFAYTAPSGFKCLVSTNLPVTNGIGSSASTQASDYFDAVIWTGTDTGTSRSFSGLQFAPDLWWSKIRSQAYGHQLFDSVRGAGSTKALASDLTAAEGAGNGATYGYLSSFDANGVTYTRGSAGSGSNPDGYAYYDELSATYVAWAWNAGGSTVTNTAGTISAQVRANTTSGFSIVQWSGSGANATIGHGLGATPAFIMVKDRSSGTNGGAVYHTSMGATKYLKLFQTTTGTDAEATDNTAWNGSSPTFNTNVFSVGSLARTNASGTSNMIAYVFAPVNGFSAFGTYTGNASAADGPFIYTGFRPAYVLIKRSSAVESWCLMDSKREGYNVDNDPLFPNLANAEGTQDFLDLLSNGFKLRSTDTGVNGSGTYIYAAFAEFPFKYSRAR